MNNMRTLAIGVTGYAHDHHGMMPGFATWPQVPWDWIYWAPMLGSPYNVLKDIAILGAPFMLSTLAMLVVAIALWGFRKRRLTTTLQFNAQTAASDLIKKGQIEEARVVPLGKSAKP